MPIESLNFQYLLQELYQAIENDFESVQKSLSELSSHYEDEIQNFVNMLVTENINCENKKILGLLVNFLNYDNLEKQLIVAILKGDVQLVEFLMKYSKPEEYGYHHWNARSIKIIELATLLIEKGAYVNGCIVYPLLIEAANNKWYRPSKVAYIKRSWSWWKARAWIESNGLCDVGLVMKKWSAFWLKKTIILAW